jgi:UDP-2,3-diacylglucosamine hydrolase
MGMLALFVSDIHLSAHTPQRVQLFLSFLDQYAMQVRDLYILGDLFSAWIGKDASDPSQEIILSALKKLVYSGVNVYSMPGNRDFLINGEYLAHYGVQWLDDFSLIDLLGVPTLLTHGDIFCTRDRLYQIYRAISHRPLTRRLFLGLPMSLRKSVASLLMREEQEYDAQVLHSKYDVAIDQLSLCLEKNRACRVIHGHTHQPGIHWFKLNNRWIERITLSDWQDRAHALMMQSDGTTTLKNF